MTDTTSMIQTATQVLDAHWDGNLPVNPVKIAAAMGVLVRADGALTESGSIEVTESGPLILVNSSEIMERRRFTIAHEIGHYALGHLSHGKTKFRDFSSNFSSRTVNTEERAANNFAAQLLMPEKMVRFLVTEEGMTDLNVLAKAFGVSQVAMQYRLTNIGLVNA